MTAPADAARAWLALDPDPDTRAELEALLVAGDAAALADRFGARLEFGTAGLRGELGAGPNRMNRVLVRRAAAGLARYLGPGGTVVIGFDARHKSDVFAADSAAVFRAAGLRALLFPRPLPTPLLALAVRTYGAVAGVMVTASHNPPRDNGYKVFLGDGAQIVPPADAAISAAIDAVGDDIALDDGYERLGDEVVDTYLEGALAAAPLRVPAADAGGLRIVYTALHGVGRDVALELLRRAGFDDVHAVAAQAEPDPDFPTVAFPNPEEPGALDLALADAARLDADIVLANDPDADRLAVAVPDGGGWRRLTGDETGWLLADALLAAEGDGREPLVVTSMVSSTLLGRIAVDYGAHYERTLTGFKWIVRPALEHPEWRFVLGYEEALGYSVGELVRDKDGITAALAFAALAAHLKSEGRTVAGALDDLAARYGRFATGQLSALLPPAAQAEVMAKARANPPVELAGRRVVAVDDLLPTADMVTIELAGGRVVLRPSGTEPKLKLYAEVVVDAASPPAAARAALDELRDAAAAWAGLRLT